MAALLWSTSGIFAKAPWFDEWPAEHRGVALTFWRSVFASVTVLPFIRRPQLRPAMITMSLSFAVMTYAFLVAMVNGSETTTVWLQYVGPAWVALAGLIGLGDRPNRRDGWMVAMSMIGIAIIVTLESTIGQGSVASGPVGLAILSSIAFAGVMLSIRQLRGVDVAWLGLVNYSVSMILLAPMVVGKVPMPVGDQWTALVGLGAIQLAIPYLMFAWAVRNVPSNEASLIALIEPLAVPIWTYLAWSQLASYRPPQWWTLLGASFIAAGLAWRYGWPQPRHCDPSASDDR